MIRTKRLNLKVFYKKDFLIYYLSKDKDVNEEFLISRFKYFDPLNNGRIEKEDFMIICIPLSNDPLFVNLLNKSDKFNSAHVNLIRFHLRILKG